MRSLTTEKSRQKIIRLRSKTFKTHKSFEIVVTYKDERNYGFFIEKIGYYCPVAPQDYQFVINTYRLGYYLNRNTILSRSVKKLLVKYLVV